MTGTLVKGHEDIYPTRYCFIEIEMGREVEGDREGSSTTNTDKGIGMKSVYKKRLALPMTIICDC